MRKTRRFRVPVAITMAVLALASAARAAELPSSPDTLARDAWQLPNGLRVVTVNIPAAQSVAVVVVYPGGRDQDPPRHEGLSLLLAELQFMAAAGDVPERSRQEMASLRPNGYDIHVSRRYTSFAELAAPAQFPGVLHQVAVRMRGVQPSPAVLAAASETARRQLLTFFQRDPAQALYYEVRERAGRTDSSSIGRLASGRGLDGLTPAELQRQLAGAYRPSDAVLCIAGNFGAIPLRRVVESEFGTLPQTAPQPPPTGLPFNPGSAIEPRHGVAQPIGVVGVLAPAIADTLHPSFYLSVLVIGAQANKLWGPPNQQLTSRFQYSLFDDPDLIRFYPDVPEGKPNADAFATSFVTELAKFGTTEADSEALDNLRAGVGWMLGGRVAPRIRYALRTESGVLNTFATCTAVRELWGGEAFWAAYRARFYALSSPAPEYWAGWMADRSRQALLIFSPGR